MICWEDLDDPDSEPIPCSYCEPDGSGVDSVGVRVRVEVSEVLPVHNDYDESPAPKWIIGGELWDETGPVPVNTHIPGDWSPPVSFGVRVVNAHQLGGCVRCSQFVDPKFFHESGGLCGVCLAEIPMSRIGGNLE